MTARNVLESQQSAHAVHAAVAGRPAAGCWKLTPGRALSLHPRQHSVLEIAQGRVWVTVSGSLSAGAPSRDADQVLQAGDRLSVAAGQHLVMEAWSLPGGAPAEGAAFCWEGAAVAAAATVATRQPAARATPEWECGVVQPLRDLLQALAQGGRAVATAARLVLHASGRLVWGATRFALFGIAAPRERRPA